MAAAPKRVTLTDFATDPTGIFEHVVNNNVTVIVESENGIQAELKPVHTVPGKSAEATASADR